MNNIEILENFIDKVDIYFDDNIGDCAITSKIAGIIENLIKEYKELEKIKQQKLDEYLYKNQWICKDLAENYIHKSKVKEIIYPTPENPISLEVQTSEMYKKLEKLVEGE